jgi:hypothetical protein
VIAELAVLAALRASSLSLTEACFKKRVLCQDTLVGHGFSPDRRRLAALKFQVQQIQKG